MKTRLAYPNIPFRIYKANSHEGWVVPDEKPETQVCSSDTNVCWFLDETLQVIVRAIIAQPSHPPKYPPNQLFVIVKHTT